MTTSNVNGRVIRKSLAEQIDRLDNILDGLAEGLNEAVTSAVTNAVALAVKEAVRMAVTEVLVNVELHKRLNADSVPGQQEEVQTRQEIQPGFLKTVLTRSLAAASLAKTRVATVLGRLCGKAGAWLKRGWGKVTAFARTFWLRTLALLNLAGRFKKPVLVSLAVGGVVGLGCFFAGPVVAGVVSGLGGFFGTLAVGMMKALRGMLGGEPAVS